MGDLFQQFGFIHEHCPMRMYPSFSAQRSRDSDIVLKGVIGPMSIVITRLIEILGHILITKNLHLITVLGTDLIVNGESG